MIQIDMDKPKDCIWADITNHIYYCPLLNEYHKCNLQDYEPRTIEEQYVHCPLHEVNTDSDTISRKAAIDAIVAQTIGYTADEIKAECEENIFNENGYLGGLKDAIEAIEDMPSAQPERTCVNCGRTINNGGWYADGRTRCPIEEHYALPKDGYCHLWEKRNVTDDDYPERREE